MEKATHETRISDAITTTGIEGATVQRRPRRTRRGFLLLLQQEEIWLKGIRLLSLSILWRKENVSPASPNAVSQGQRVAIAGIVLDTIYNASRHQGKVTLGVGSMASILTYATRMPIPPYQAQATDIFRYMDGAFLKKIGLVDEVKIGNTVVYRWKSWERRVGQSSKDEGTSHAQAQR
ncbi:hypothetical protein JCGZ_23714 [Jatropha curcas]|uniref:Uncharacterized protein n=1 Tax=Jatropha curcas TaxID=180498 RepID=A0A067K1U9_JATCU|nr:hypothetical protein JCGZ_23714 [Jatropha curcas]